MEILYKHIKDFSIQEVFNATKIGFVFEFYSTQQTAFMAEDLSRICGKMVVITSEKTMTPTWTSPILLKEYEGKNPRYKFITSPQDFLSVEPILNGILEWINRTAKTDKSTGLQISLSYNNAILPTLNTISNMDVKKLILKIDEEYLFNRFPDRKDSPYSISVRTLIPVNEFVSSPSGIGEMKGSFIHPVANYYGIDFTDQTFGELKFNYIGGKDYAKKIKEISEALQYYIISTYQVLNIPEYSHQMGINLERMFEDYSKIRRAYYDPAYFLSEFKNIKVGLDLKTDERIISTYWSKLREPITKLMMENGLREGKFNLDTEEGRFQIKDAKLVGGKIKGMDIVDCQIQSIIEDCGVWNCKINSSRLILSTLVTGNKVENSVLEKVRADRENSIKKSWIYNSGEIINCEVNESIIKNAGIGKEAKLDEECTVVEPKYKISPTPEPIQPDEIRDYKWLKGLNTEKKNDGFQNEFKHKW